MKIQPIQFSHRYVKMPHGVEYLETFIKDVAIIYYRDLTLEQIKEDTEIVGGGQYKLPHGKLIWIKLWTPYYDPVDKESKAKEWGTMRPYKGWKFVYYRGLIGQQVQIIINETQKT